jgi:hypothetical protein
MKSTFNTRIFSAAVAAMAVTVGTAGARASDFSDAIGATKPILDLRLRYETVDQANLARDADALTFRMRAGFETGKFLGTSLLAEGEWVADLVNDYNSTTNGKTGYPVVADPRGIELNRLQLTNTSLPGTTVTLGRQRINLDDQRFVGNAGWRQNEQTFDAVRVVNTSIPKLTLDGIYLNQVNRVFGPNSSQGRFHGDTVLANARYDLGFGAVSAFGYWIGLDDAPGNSSRTLGARFAGQTAYQGITITYAASIANQKDWKANPADYSVMYYLAEGSVTWRGLMAGAGWEQLGGNGAKGFQTPLATLHKFDGWADVFLTTPANGLVDTYAKTGYTVKNAGPFSSLGVQAVYHRFDAARGPAALGREFDMAFVAAWRAFEFTVKYASYRARTFAADTDKVWVQLDYKL